MKNRSLCTRHSLFAVVGLAALLLLTFFGSFSRERVLFTSDDPLGLLRYWKSLLPSAWLANWAADNLIGFGVGQASFTPSQVLLWLLPAHWFANWIYALAAFGAGVFFFLFLRLKNCSPLASLLGAVVYCYASCNFSLVHSGHIGKFGCYLWFAATLWAMEHGLQKSRAWSWRVLTGGFLGLAVAEQPDVAILFVQLFVVYLALRLFTRPDLTREQALFRLVGTVVFAGVVSGLVAANVVFAQYRTQVQGVAQLSPENREQAWHWATQWSYPPAETLELVAPGFFGWRVDDPAGPYWGVTGRSAEYEATKQGFPRFKLDTSFIGIVPIFLAVAMAVYAFGRRYRDNLEPSLRRELMFWAVIAVVTLLLAFGRHFFLYHFFYSLPKMNIIRNPNKFLHLFSVAVAILAAHGFHHLLEQRGKPLDTRWLWRILGALAAAALLGAVYVFAANESLVARFQEEFQKASALIVANMSRALLRLAVSAGIFAVLWFLLLRLAESLPRVKTVIPVLVLLLALTDLYLTNRHYVQYYEHKPMYAENEFSRFLKSDPEPHRVKILPRNPRDPWFPLYNNWLTIYFPYHRIQSFDIPQMPRMPLDYQQFLAALEPNPLRLWQLANCKYLLAPYSLWQQLQQDPILQPHFTVAHLYNLASSNNFIVTLPASPQTINPNTQVILRYENALPRLRFYDRWQVIRDDRLCLRTLASPEFDPAVEVIVSDPIAPPTNIPPAATHTPVEWLHRSDNIAHLRLTTDCPGILLFNEKYDPNFRVSVDGQPSQLLRCNYIMKGVRLDPGTHEVRFEYRPPRIGFYLTLVGWFGCLIAVPLLRIVETRQEHAQRRKPK